MPKAGPLSPDEVVLREELHANVQKLAGEIGERNMCITHSSMPLPIHRRFLSRAGLRTRRTVTRRGTAVSHIVAEISGNGPEIIVLGAHYDSVLGSPGANDNGSGAAAVLALALRFC